ncbi:MAG TPA: hypothetical protein VIV56_07510 [Gemmatimonadales bacterium]
MASQEVELFAEGGCCALDEGHDGTCAFVCSDCNGTTYCWACEGPSGDDLGNGCGECDGTGYCFFCHEGLVSDDA